MKIFLLMATFFYCTIALGADGYVSYEAFQRLTSPATEQDNSDWLGLSFATEKIEHSFDSFAEADFRFYHGDNDYMFSIPEAYLRYQRSSRLTFTLGRQVLDWNAADSFWRLGDLNGRQAFSLLGDKEEGIVGLNVDMRLGQRTRLELFASYLYIPTFNPGYQFKDGEVSSRSEWVRLPPSQTTILEEEVPIYYDYESVNIPDVIFQESLGARLTYEFNRKNNMSGYILYKPENSLRTNAEGRLSEAMDCVTVTPKPYVNHHFLAGVNFSSQLGRRFFISGGYEFVDPNADLKADLLVVDPVTFFENDTDDFDSEYFKIRPELERNHYLHFAASWVGTLREFSIQLINSLNSFEDGGDDFFGGKVKWRRAAGLLFKRHFTDYFNASVDFKYDFLMRDSILRSELSLRFLKNFVATAGVELIRSPKKESYWSSYRSNDILFTNLRYLF